MKHLPFPSMPSPIGQRGFTLVELVVTLAVLAIVTSMAVPAFDEMLRQWRRDSATRELSTTLGLARSEAIKTSRQTVVCPSTNGTACAATNEWLGGWLLFVDDGAGTQANANNQERDTNERLLKRVGPQSGLATLTSPAGVQRMQFLPNGIMRTGAAGNITFTVTPSNSTSSTKVDKIRVSPVGHLTIVTELP